MASSSGIVASQELKAAFAAASTDDSNVQFLKVVIQNDAEFVVSAQGDGASDDSASDDEREAANFRLVNDALEDEAICFVLFKQQSASKKKWLMMAFVPDLANVKLKMIYASSRQGLKASLGASAFGEDFFFSERLECSRQFFLQSKQAVSDQDRQIMQTELERTKAEAENESQMQVGLGNMKMASLPIRVTPAAIEALTAIQDASQRFAMFCLDPKTEELDLDPTADIVSNALPETVPAKSPRFCLIHFQHANPNTDLKSSSLIFVYWCPESASAREKMFYSTVRNNMIDACDQLKIAIDKKIEVTESGDLSSSALISELYPASAEKKSFARPAARGRARAKRSRQKFSPQ